MVSATSSRPRVPPVNGNWLSRGCSVWVRPIGQRRIILLVGLLRQLLPFLKEVALLTLTKTLRQRPVVLSLSVGGLMATIWLVACTTLAYPPRVALAVLVGAVTSFSTYARQPGPSQDSVRTALFLTFAISLVCLVGMLLAAGS